MAYATVTTINDNSKKNIINNPTKLHNLIKNNEISILRLFKYRNIDYYKQLFELLKTNTSIFHIKIRNNDNTDEYYKLLSDYLMFKNNLKKISLAGDYMSDDNCKLIYDALKNSNNISLITIRFRYNYLNDNSLKYIIDFLKFNNTLKFVYIVVCEALIDGVIIAELLRTNITINKLAMISQNIKNLNVLEKVMENNRYITHLDMFHNSKASINGYCKRNKYNNNLKSLMLQDL
jgi:hypothetical protein